MLFFLADKEPVGEHTSRLRYFCFAMRIRLNDPGTAPVLVGTEAMIYD